MRTEFHHQKEGVLVSWWHACHHFSNPMWYRDAETAELVRWTFEETRCWDCRNSFREDAP